jgi:hypothetical protein
MPVVTPDRPRTAPSEAVRDDDGDENAPWRLHFPDFDIEPDVPDVDDYEPPHDDGGGDDDDDDDDDDGPVRWVTVATFWHSTRAHIAKLKLESEEIDCVLFDEHLNWLCATCGGGIKLQVPEPDAPRARGILRTRANANGALADDPRAVLDYVEEGQSAFGRANVCPHCGDAVGELLPVLRRAGAVAVPLVIAGVMAPAWPVVSLLIAAASALTLTLPRYRCPRCAGEWAIPGNAHARPESRGFDAVANDSEQ